MYIKYDGISPIINDYIAATKIKNDLLNYWPTTTVNGEEVFDKIYYYDHGVIPGDRHTSYVNWLFYNYLGMSTESLNEDDANGTFKTVDYAWLEFQRPTDALFTTSTTNILNEINLTWSDNPSVIIKCYKVKPKHHTDGWDDPITDVPSVFFEALKYSGEIFTMKELLLYIDKNEDIVTIQKVREVGREYLVYNNNDYVNMNVEIVYKYKNKVTLESQVATALDEFLYLANLDISMWYDSTSATARYYAEAMNKLRLSAITIANKYETSFDPTPYMIVYNDKYYLKTSVLNNLELKFLPNILTSIGSGSTNTPPTQEERIGAITVKVISIALIIVGTVLTGGSATGLLVTGYSTTIIVLTGSASIIVGSLLPTVVSSILDRQGKTRAAMAVNGVAQVVEDVSESSSYLILFISIHNIIKTGIIEYIRRLSTSKLISYLLEGLNYGADIYYSSIDADFQNKIESKEAEIAAIEKELSDLPSPRKYELEKQYFNEYKALETTDNIDYVIYNQTQGKLDNATQVM